jgi:mevalonate kinase
MSWCCRVPGKAVLLGEYAVTDGLAAYSLAVNRCAEVRLTPCSKGQGGLLAPQVWPETVGFRIEERSTLRWDSEARGWSRVRWTAGLIDRLLEVFDPAELVPFELAIDTASLFIDHQGQRHKLGLGSSSAITVGLFKVLAKFLDQAGPEAPDELLATLLPVYRALQQGQGSGIDLATSIHGGLIEFRHRAGQVETRSQAWPDGVLIDFAWTGHPASTPELLLRYRDWQQARPDQAARWHRMASDLLDAAARALSRGDAEALVGLIGEYGRGMSTIGGWMGVDLTPDVHLRIMQRAEQLGLAAKPSGAGVGDLALIAGTCPEAMASMRHWLHSEGIARVEMQAMNAGAELLDRSPED